MKEASNMMKKAAEEAVAEVERIKQNTAIIKFDFSAQAAGSEFSKHNHLVEKYVNEHKLAIKKHKEAVISGDATAIEAIEKSGAFGTFNDFLEEHFRDNPEYKDKVIVAEISGNLEEPSQDGGVNLEGGDFSGGRFVDADISSSLKGVALRDCYFEKVLVKSAVTGVDFRGSKLKNCTFFGYSPTDLDQLGGLHFSFANAAEVQKLGLFSIKDDLGIATAKANAEKSAATKTETKIKALEAKIDLLKQKFASEQGNLAWAASLIKADNFENREEIINIRARIEEIKVQAKENLEKELQKIENSSFINLDKVETDPTYVPNQSPSDAARKKISIEATRDDLVAYLKMPLDTRPGTFQDYVLGIKAVEKNKDAIFVVDLSKENISGLNLSGLNLSGVNFAYTTAIGTIFTGAQLVGSCFEGATVDGAIFTHANLTDANCIGIKGNNEVVDFEHAILVRTQLQYAKLQKVKMDHAILYSADLTGIDMEGGHLAHADARRADFENGNLRSIDARYVKMRMANLSGAVLEEAKLHYGDFTGASMEGVKARRVEFNHTIMDEVKARRADFRNAIMEELQSADHADFTEAKLNDIKARLANFERSIMDRVEAVGGEFTDAVMRDVKARGADFSKAVLFKVHGERMDVSDAILRDAKMMEAHLEEAIMVGVHAEGVNLTKAHLEDAHLEHAKLTKAILEEAYLMRAHFQAANLSEANMEGADVKGAEFDKKTLLFDANLRGLKNDPGLKDLQKQQHEIRDKWFGESRYGFCKSNSDGTNTRFECQRLGAMVLSIAMGGGSGFAMAGPLGGLSAAVVSGMIADESLIRLKDYCGRDYIDNSIGDRLAEIGVVAQSLGVNAANRAIDGAAAGLICSSVGVMKATGVLVGGAAVAAGGMKLAQSETAKKFKIAKYVGAGLAGAGGIAAAVGGASMGASSSAVAYGAAAGAALGATTGARDAIKSLLEYDENKGTGKRPEQLYIENVEKAHKVWEKIMPTPAKLLAGVLLAGAFLATTCLTGGLILGTSVAALVLIAEVAAMTTTAGFVLGYLHGDKIPLLNKLHTRAEVQQSPEVAAQIEERMGVSAESDMGRVEVAPVL